MATSGATLFRSIGGSIGVARLRRDLRQPARERARRALPRARPRRRRPDPARGRARCRRRSTTRLRRRVRRRAAPRVPVAAAVSALVAFVLTWLLRERAAARRRRAAPGSARASRAAPATTAARDRAGAVSCWPAATSAGALRARGRAGAGWICAPPTLWLLARLGACAPVTAARLLELTHADEARLAAALEQLRAGSLATVAGDRDDHADSAGSRRLRRAGHRALCGAARVPRRVGSRPARRAAQADRRPGAGPRGPECPSPCRYPCR